MSTYSRPGKGRDARTIKPREVVELLDGIVQRGSRVMANRVAGLLSQMFRFGVHRDSVEASPVQLLYRPGGKERPKIEPSPIPRSRRCSPVWMTCCARPAWPARSASCSSPDSAALELALARWRDVDFEAKTWMIPAAHSKTGVAHLLPISPAAAKEFERLKRIAGRQLLHSAERGRQCTDRSEAHHAGSGTQLESLAGFECSRLTTCAVPAERVLRSST